MTATPDQTTASGVGSVGSVGLPTTPPGPTAPTDRRLRVLSGMQPTGRMHIGNYLGALQNWIALQDGYDCVYFVADYHALTATTESASLPANIEEMVLDWLAAGLDPERSIIYRQSDLPEVTELHLLLSMSTPLGWLERVPTWKEKSEQNPDNLNYGLLGYPVLQAADILLPRGERVPVGEDQLPHLELTREIARRFNHLYAPVFPEPQALVTEVARVLGTDGAAKMSKSRNNAIGMTDDAETVSRTVMTMVTDVERPRRTDPGHPDRCNVCRLHRTFSPDHWQEIWAAEKTATTGCVEVKQELARAITTHFAPMRERREELRRQPGVVWEILADGADRARATARQTLEVARDACGLGRTSRVKVVTPSR